MTGKTAGKIKNDATKLPKSGNFVAICGIKCYNKVAIPNLIVSCESIL